VNFPDVQLSIRALTEKDREDLIFGLANGVDWVALSFVRNPSDMEEIKALIRSHGHSTPVVAKIEKFEAIDQIDAILPLCDGVMVARGDLGVEMPAEEVPLLQKELIRKANSLGIPIITATQMLDSMASCPRPTRAEAERCGQRDPRWHRCSDALERNRRRRLPGGSGGDDGHHRPPH
jgi:pyruvate kinase